MSKLHRVFNVSKYALYNINIRTWAADGACFCRDRPDFSHSPPPASRRAQRQMFAPNTHNTCTAHTLRCAGWWPPGSVNVFGVRVCRAYMHSVQRQKTGTFQRCTSPLDAIGQWSRAYSGISGPEVNRKLWLCHLICEPWASGSAPIQHIPFAVPSQILHLPNGRASFRKVCQIAHCSKAIAFFG